VEAPKKKLPINQLNAQYCKTEPSKWTEQDIIDAEQVLIEHKFPDIQVEDIIAHLVAACATPSATGGRRRGGRRLSSDSEQSWSIDVVFAVDEDEEPGTTARVLNEFCADLEADANNDATECKVSKVASTDRSNPAEELETMKIIAIVLGAALLMVIIFAACLYKKRTRDSAQRTDQATEKVPPRRSRRSRKSKRENLYEEDKYLKATW